MTDFNELERRVTEKLRPSVDHLSDDLSSDIIRAIHEISISNAIHVLAEYEKMKKEQHQ